MSGCRSSRFTRGNGRDLFLNVSGILAEQERTDLIWRKQSSRTVANYDLFFYLKPNIGTFIY